MEKMRKLNVRERKTGGDGVVVIITVKAHKTGPLPFVLKKRNFADGLIDCCLTILDYEPIGPAEIAGLGPPVTIAERIVPPGRSLPKLFPVAFIHRFYIGLQLLTAANTY